ncbi:MAG: hypothetical protein K9K21_01195 [Desulfotignum sp.]|nr:hypothetical protein [Desulfotignum sp.]MCF8112447.1 hypothetical protein [Desulfotignum sp.]MCF8124822.1 hypothetical protein [Desulfotignum sp.]
MLLDQNPFFRKTIAPWYDSNPACWILMGFLLLVFVFALAGVAVACADPALADHVWFPVMLAVLSFILTVKIFFRLRLRDKND